MSPASSEVVVPRRVPRIRMGAACLAAILAVASGCQQPLMRPPERTPRSDRLRAHYADLDSGRFAVIADFEQPSHMELFRAISPSRKAEIRLSAVAGVAQTGPHCLQFTLAGPDDALVASNEQVTEWFMKRDWREYDLLIMQLHAPRAGIEVEVAIAAGSTGGSATVHSLLPLREGWNLVRLDLTEVAEHVPLDDIAELRWSVPAATEPIRLAMDDVILANNTQDLFGNSETTDGRLYIRRRGRQWAVGASGRFELGFSGGQITHWYDLAGDPNRLSNLVANTVMGPSPIVMPADQDDPESTDDGSDFAALGDTVVARQRVLEASPVRIVLESEWRFTKRGQAPPDDSPFQRWSYAVYPSGTVYTRTECTTTRGEWRPDDIGLAVSRADRGNMDVVRHPPAQLEDAERLRHVSFGFVASKTLDSPALLVVMHNARKAPVLEYFAEPETRRATLVASGGTLDRDNTGWTCLLNTWPADNASGTSPVDRALDYCFPGGRIHVDAGALVTNDPGDDDADGFNERLGTYVLAPDGQQLRFALDGRQQRMFHPAFCVKHSAGAEAWVYVDGAVLEPTGRDRDGNLVFQIPSTVQTAMTVDVYLRDRTAPNSQ